MDFMYDLSAFNICIWTFFYLPSVLYIVICFEGWWDEAVKVVSISVLVLHCKCHGSLKSEANGFGTLKIIVLKVYLFWGSLHSLCKDITMDGDIGVFLCY